MMCLSFTGVHFTVNMVYTASAEAELYTCTVTLLTLRQSSSQVFIFLLLLVPMNLINTCKENIVTFLAASGPLSPGSGVFDTASEL